MTEPAHTGRSLTRRRLLLGAAGVGGVVVAGAAGYALAPERVKTEVESRLGVGPEPYIPDAPEGQIRLERIHSEKRGKDVDFFTAVPDGYGAGSDLPVVVILHGASATAANFEGFGLGRFLTQAVLDGAEPFVLAGADGGVLRWLPDPGSGDDPQAMVVDEIPAWLAKRGFDADRRALWGWSMGGYGTLALAETYPHWALAVAAFSPAMRDGDAIFDNVATLTDLPLGIWCGTDDPLYPTVRKFVAVLPEEPQIASYSDGAHTRVYWNDQTLDAFAFLSQRLAAAA